MVYTAGVRHESKGSWGEPSCWGRSTLRLEAIEKLELQATRRAVRGLGSLGSKRSLWLAVLHICLPSHLLGHCSIVPSDSLLWSLHTGLRLDLPWERLSSIHQEGRGSSRD